MEPHERPAYGALALGGLLGLLGGLLGIWVSTWDVPFVPDEGMAAGLAGAAVLIGFAVAGVLLLAGLALLGVGWWSLRTDRTRVPSVVVGAGLGFVGTGLLAVLAPSMLVLSPVAALLGAVVGHRLAPAPPGTIDG